MEVTPDRAALPTDALPTDALPTDALPSDALLSGAQPGESRPVSPSRAEAWTAWEDVAPVKPKRKPLFSEARGAYGSYDDPVPRRNAMFQITLGLFLGLALALVLYISLADAWGPFVTAPALVLGLPLVFARRNILRHLGFGLLVSVPTGALISLAATFMLRSLV